MTSDERAAPFYCPYCGDEDLRPEDPQTTPRREAPPLRAVVGEGPAGWLCSACRRVFSVKFLGLSLPEVSR
ncbi:Insertion element protein [Amycolatopsis sp. A133]|uniref:Insertion element protein n=1 Tax=Amycolatopsis sp. A133 TaxID=3064472 RepID=UPI0027F78D95|nr:Insertion element protein [Amycolatopsis sp. A133]MDQ7806992.1 Insertion element protein [Amycolatopsis sp. A133]